MAVFSKYAQLLDYHLPYNCYEIGHTWTPYCIDASVYVGLHAFRESLKIYLPLYAASLLYSKRYDGTTIKRTLQAVLISSFFLSFNAFAFIAVFCSLSARCIVGEFAILKSSVSRRSTGNTLLGALGELIVIAYSNTTCDNGLLRDSRLQQPYANQKEKNGKQQRRSRLLQSPERAHNGVREDEAPVGKASSRVARADQPAGDPDKYRVCSKHFLSGT
ncbi:hypothetical protein HPB52_016162 [Rhipicephalus sanguineus]|uniref:Transmembrane protein 135 N-terminal domain-containing protein n=1 Tax=Rhipicephalus sanguineus TaxID=34632 RepID=A0A9D4SUN6_RHISA|nr:hypothetical protein HPB52_016162 [Rhipicephalus sanguineus]